MSYGNNYNNYPYQPSPSYSGNYSYYQPTQPPVQPQQTINTNKLYANGIEDVRCRQLPVNSDFIFLDNDKPLIYRKSTDATGKMDIQVFKIVPYQEEESQPAVDMSLYALKSDFDELKKEIASLKSSLKTSTQKQDTKKTI